MAEEATPLASPHTVTSASVGTALATGAGTISAFTMNQPTSTSIDDSTPLTLVDPFTSGVGSAAIAGAGTGGVAGSAVYAVGGGVGAPALLNVTVGAAVGITAINSVANPGDYTTFPPSPAPLTYVSGVGSGVTGATVTLTEAGPSAGIPAHILFSASLRALASMYEPRPGVALTPGLTAPTWPKTLMGATPISFTNGCYVQSCPANMTFTVSI